MATHIKTVEWRFRDCSVIYPELKHTMVPISGPQDIFKHFRFLFKGRVNERFVVFWLNSANRVIGFEIISEGILNSSLVHPREVYRGAIVATSAAIIIAHNHPSGNPEPSGEDIAITKQIADAGKIIGIPTHDHIIFTEAKYTSFAERGLI